MSEKDINGQAGIVNGEVVVTNPQEDGTPALLYPAEEGVTIFVNGEVLEAPLEVFEDDVIDLTPLVITEEASCTVNVSADTYSSELTVTPRRTFEYRILDTEMSRELKPRVEKDIKLEKAVTLEEADEQLKAKNVVFGIDFAALKNALDRASGEPEIVARGQKVREGENGRIDFQVATEIETITYDESSQKRIDFREKFRFPAVKKGELIAIVHPPVEGVSGQTVTGKVIMPKPVKSVKVKCGEGVELLEEKREIIAQRDGLLMVTGTVIKVVNFITHNGDVNLESGNIRFNGDVRIFGNIMENMLVDARGNIYVEGNGYGAAIKAGEGIQVTRNIIKCQVEGGLHFFLLEKVLMQVRILEKEYTAFLNALQQVASALAGKGEELDKNYFQRIARAVLQKLSSNIPERLNQIESIIKDNDDYQFESLKKTTGILQKMLAGKMEIDGMAVPQELGSSLRVFLDGGEEIMKDIPPLSAAYVQNSVIKHRGDIQITGAGSYYSLLQSGGGVTVQGVFRGGSIEAQGDVRVREFFFISTENVSNISHIRIKVPAHSSIYFDLVQEDVTVQVGKMVYRFDHDYSKVKIAYDPASGLLKLANF